MPGGSSVIHEHSYRDVSFAIRKRLENMNDDVRQFCFSDHNFDNYVWVIFALFHIRIDKNGKRIGKEV